MIRVLLADDEEPARSRLRQLLNAHHDVEIVAETGDGPQTIERIHGLRPDLVFLDIQMPGCTGLKVASSLKPPRPHIIFCTAFDHYAISAFEHHAVDYLLKPVNRERLAEAVGRTRNSLKEQEELRREAAAASAVQKRLFPQTLPAMTSLDYGGFCQPANAIGGDYYDFLELGPGKLGVALGDISGKGLYAGLLMASLQARLQSLAPIYSESLSLLVARLNRELYDSTETNKYATFFYGIYEDRSRHFTYVNAGHLPPLLFRASHDHPDQLEPTGMAIGLLHKTQFHQQVTQMNAGDLLLLFTDGIIEALNLDGQEFGLKRLQEAVMAHGSLPAAMLLEKVLGELKEFTGECPPFDDLTLIILKGKEEGIESSAF